MNLPIQTISNQIEAQFVGDFLHDSIENIVIDSRSLQNNRQTLFFALIGPNYDAQQFIQMLIKKNVRNFVVSNIPKNLEGKANFLVVNDTLVALQKFATNKRNLYRFPVIGITGSNGKTIVKEWLNFVLGPDFNIIRSPKSYNSQVGVALSIISINAEHNLGVFEAGISTVSEMDKLEKMIRPTIGLLTNIGSAHNEGFANTEQKIQEKLKLFLNSEVIIYQKNKIVEKYLTKKTKRFSWSFTDKNATVFIKKNQDNNYQFFGDFLPRQDMNHFFSFPFRDAAAVENTICCIMIMLYFRYNFKTIQNRILMLYTVEMRLKVKNGINNTTIIDDSYSSDFQSLKIALDFLESQKQHKKKTVILSDIVQSGFSDKALYGQIAEILKAHKIDRIIGIGHGIFALKEYFENLLFFEKTKDFLDSFDLQDFSHETILIKGARSFNFEDIVLLLEEKTHETVLEINLNSISHNYNFYKSKLEDKVKIMVMIKAFGYGNGGFEIAKLLEHHNADYLGVAFADEGRQLRLSGIILPIMVMNPETTSYLAIIQHQLEPEIYSLKGLNSFLKLAKEKNLENYPIHIKIDTGMHRLGFENDSLGELIETLENNNTVVVKSILSHLATSDNLIDHSFALSQIALFKKLSLRIMNELQISPIRHILNTSGISNFPEAQFDMVRLGIGLYGISNDQREQPFLETVGTLKSIISQLRIIKKGESVGYGQNFIASKPTKIATIPIGYADGISRKWGNEVGFITIDNQKAKIVGNICMDMLMADVSKIDCREGDQVIVFGQSPSVIFMAKKLKTIPYEIMSTISQRVKRIFFRE